MPARPRLLAVFALAAVGCAPAAAAPAAAPTAAAPTAAPARTAAPKTAPAETAAPAAPEAAAVAGRRLPDPAPSLHDFTATTIDGKQQKLAAYAGKVLLVVNTASECGFTPQYEGLEKLWRTYKDQGLVVLGFPSNDFGGQEPGSEKQIKAFCKKRYGVSFPLFAKSVVSGKDASPIYQFLARGVGEPQWNFHKYLVGKDGVVIQAFGTKVTPDDALLRAAIESALAGK